MPDPGNQPADADSYDPGRFDWPLCHEGEEFLRKRMREFLERNRTAKILAARLRDDTATDFFEWIDHLVLSPGDESPLRDAGFITEDVETPSGETVLHHPRATLPRVILRETETNPSALALRPEYAADFAARMNLAADGIEGEPFSRYRRVVVVEENGTRLEAVERNAYRGFVPEPLRPEQLAARVKAGELWQTRRRRFGKDAAGFAEANRLLEQSIEWVGRDLSCHYFFQAERAWWESRNRAGRLQRFRQDRLGLGWGNHDHHTFRCSRGHFVDLVQFLLRLGFEKRERYYAGAEAGWGAQVSEHPATGIVVFADVDLLPEETELDFSALRLPPAPRPGTVGLWVGLHGESFLDAGMHHLEARFDHALLREQLSREGIKTMNPFSDFEFLHQAFTEGERWTVPPERAEKLLEAGWITRDQLDKFVKEGALGSHLENLQRHGGFKGFNQKSVSAIIEGTDPRKEHFQPVSA